MEPELPPPLHPLMNTFDQFADRSSHLIGLYSSGLKKISNPNFIASYFDTPTAFVVANEPICAAEKKVETVLNLAAYARGFKKRLTLFPCGTDLARNLTVNHRFHSLMIGVEAIFNLKNYFDDSVIDPLEAIPAARLWKKRGARVEKIAGTDLTPEHRLQIGYLTDQWKKSKSGPKLAFLNRTEPLEAAGKKTYFFLRNGAEICAFLALSPIPAENSYYTADYIRSPNSKAGAIEFLLVESMRALRKEKVKEVRMGLSPLARLSENPLASGADRRFRPWLNRVFRKVKSPYSFASIYEFKQKLEPTRWEPLYLVSTHPVKLRTFWEVLTAVFEKNPLAALADTKFAAVTKLFTSQLNALSQSALLPERHYGLNKASLALAAVCGLLHGLRMNTSTFAAIFADYGFRSIEFSWLGWVIGPFFHNTTYHLLGDLASLVFFGYFFEVFFGVRRALPIIAIGLWASNPVTVSVLAPILRHFHPEAALHLLSEVDYGSSNAVYALVGAWAATLRRPSILIIPFLFNGLVVCHVKESILALHHWFALVMGMAYFRRQLSREVKPAQFQ